MNTETYNLTTLLPLGFTIILILLFALYVTLYFIMRYHWRRYAFNEQVTRRFLFSYIAIGAITMCAGIVGLLLLFN